MDEFKEVFINTVDGWEDQINNLIHTEINKQNYVKENLILYSKRTFNKDENKFWVEVDFYERVFN